MMARGSPNSISAAASTMRVLPEPVGPKNSKFPTGRPGEFNPAQNTRYRSTSACTPSSCPTIFDRSEVSKPRVSLLRIVGSSCWRAAAFIGVSSCWPGWVELTSRLMNAVYIKQSMRSTIPHKIHYLGERLQSQQDTEVSILETVSLRENLFQPSAK